MWFKTCPRCKGDLYLRDNIDSHEIVCIQCSYILRQEEKLLSRLRQQMPERAKVREKVA
jgi:hypothetical protein